MRYTRRIKGGGKVSTQRIKAFEKESSSLVSSLSAKNLKVYKENPHLRQVFAEGRVPETREMVQAEDRYLKDGDPARDYTDIKRPKTVEHLGQRKLLLSEIEFLTHNLKEGDTVVYAGSAPGVHLVIIADMFPGIKLILYDPNRFVPVVKSITKEVYTEYFTDKIATKLASEIPGEKMLFISDIRTEPTDAGVTKDMKMQQKWIEIMKPRKSLLKCRLPYGKGKFTYFKGKFWIQCFAPQTSTETRLELEGVPEMVEYDNKKYEDQMFYFNTMKRAMYYKHRMTSLGYDHCYDCSAELFILREYVKSKFTSLSVEELKKKIDTTLVPLFKSFQTET
jgi:hypothetical protein